MPPSPSRTVHLAWVALAALAVAVAGCAGSSPPSDRAAGGEPPPQKVAVVKPQRKNLERTVSRPAQVEPFDVARLFAKVPAYVERYLVDIGDKVAGPTLDAEGKIVEPGQRMVELSAPELDEDVRQKAALVAQAAADVEQAQAAIDVARANAAQATAEVTETVAAIRRFEAEHERWSSEYERVVQLVSKSAVTQKLADETKAQLAAAEAAREEAEAKVESARSAAAAAEALVAKAMADEVAVRARRDVAEAEQARATALVNYLHIDAPFSGTVTERNAEIGAFAHAGGGAAAQPLFTVARSDRVRVFVDLPEMDVPWVDDGDPAIVRVQVLAGQDFPGTVTRTAWALDSQTRTLRAEVDVPNPDGRLRSGMYAQVTIHLARRPNVLTLPLDAVVSKDGTAFCFAVDGGKLVRKPLVLGLQAGGEVEIVSGLSGKETVAAKGAGLAEGQRVEIAEAAAK